MWGLLSVGFAQVDTLDTLSLPAVQIEDRLMQRMRNTAHQTIFRADSFGNFEAVGLTADAILRQAPGLYVRNYGGHGGVRTLSMRGFGAAQTTVSINGIPYQSPQTGVVDFGHFYPEGYASIDITQGGSSGDPSIAPLGGNVNFTLAHDSAYIRLQVGGGAFGEEMGGLFTHHRKGKWHAGGGIQFLRAEDNYPFAVNGETGIRQGADFDHQRMMYQLGYIDSLWTFQFMGFGFQQTQQVPGPILTGNPESPIAVLKQQDQFHSLKIDHTPGKVNTWQPFRISWALSYHLNDLVFTPATGAQSYKNQDVQGQVSITHLGTKTRWQTVLQVQPAWLRGNNLAIGFQPVDAVQRTIWRAGVSRQGFFSWKKNTLTHTLTGRMGYTLADGWLPEGSLSLHLKRPKGWAFFTHSHAGRRLPAFNELYYFGYGNANLVPERAIGGDLGVLKSWEFAKGQLRLKGNIFVNRTLNKIVAIPLNPAVWSTRSIGRSRSMGWEGTAEWRHAAIQAYMSYTRQDVRDLSLSKRPFLPYTPPEIMNYGVTLPGNTWEMGVHGHVSGWRFSSPVIESSTFLPRYHIMDAQVQCQFKLAGFQYRLQLAAENIWDTDYVVIQSYPMPGRSWRVRLFVQW